MFNLPEKHLTYNQDVFLRAKYNITVTKAWEGISFSSLNAWLNNFDNDDPLQLFFAHRVLDNLIYRSRDQFVTLLKTMLNISLPSLLAEKLSISITNANDLIYGRTNNHKLFFVPTTSSYDITASSPYLARELAIHLKVDEDSFVRFDDVSKYVNDKNVILVFIDDICSTGSQFCRSVSKKLFTHLSTKKCKVFYTPLALHEMGRDRLVDDCLTPKLIDGFTSVEWLDNTYNCFSEKSRFSKWSKNSHGKNLSKFYLDFLNQNIPDMYNNEDEKLGYGKLSLLYSFYYRAPNNSLPVIWTNDNNWSPLIKR